MLTLEFSRNFIKQAKKLEQKEARKLAQLLEVLRDNPFDSRLHTKKLSAPLLGMWAFRISREYRVTFTFQDETTIYLIDVDHRKNIYK